MVEQLLSCQRKNPVKVVPETIYWPRFTAGKRCRPWPRSDRPAIKPNNKSLS